MSSNIEVNTTNWRVVRKTNQASNEMKERTKKQTMYSKKNSRREMKASNAIQCNLLGSQSKVIGRHGSELESSWDSCNNVLKVEFVDVINSTGDVCLDL